MNAVYYSPSRKIRTRKISRRNSSIAIGKSLEIGKGYSPNLFSCGSDAIVNPHQLNIEKLMDDANYSMQLWMDN